MFEKKELKGKEINMTFQSITMKDEEEEYHFKQKIKNRSFQLRAKIVILILVGLVFVAGMSGYLIGKAENAVTSFERPVENTQSIIEEDKSTKTTENSTEIIDLPDRLDAVKPSASKLRVFRKAAVCADVFDCSKIGSDILNKKGSAVDATIAVMFCNGLLNMQSMGLGGGFYMNIYIKEEGKAYVVNARETAPGAATVDMFNGNSDESSLGPLSSAVPGQLRGMWAAYKRWGQLPWENLVTPTLDLCRNGFPLSKYMHWALNTFQRSSPFWKDQHLVNMFYNSATDQFYTPGTIIKPAEELCNTFEQIAIHGGDVLYNGTLAKDFLDDLQSVGSIITAEDLKNYQPKIMEPITVPLSNGDILYAPPPPSGGIILVNILNILSGYNFNASSISSMENKILTYHRIIEAFKFGYATRTKLGDLLDLSELVRNVTSPQYGADIRSRINDDMTSNDYAAYGANFYNPPDAGTAHMAIIAPNGNAVSVTSSINQLFGAVYMTKKTGIVMNDVMDDFSSPGIINKYNVEPSPANFIAPHKRPLSSMSPSIIVDSTGNPRLVVGSAGGSKITTTTAMLTIRKLWFGQTIKEAMDEPRFHHQLIPMNVAHEFDLPDPIVKGLRAKGHKTVPFLVEHGSVACALYQDSTGIYGNADWRKGGDVAGIN